ncbi:MAG: serine/threonine protein kinase [Deltaproteobacteria bacterium]|nr:serine/threonine protein kinase [Deltaproteobacteria bacterium]
MLLSLCGTVWMGAGRAKFMSDEAASRGYRIVKPLGQGGMGTVFVTEKVTTHQTYAIKFLKEDYAKDATYLNRFEREIQALLGIRHPHVVNIFDWWFPGPDEKGKPFVVMELLDGEGLDQRLRGNRLLRPAIAVKIMLQTLDGLAAAHRTGVIHRDLGPSNIFLCMTNTELPLVKILDFGLARPMVPGDEEDSNLTTAGTLMGKPGYVAPEMFLEQPLDARSDIFACGMMLYRMLAGRLPFRNTQQQTLWVERFAEIRSGGELPALSHFASWVPAALEQVVMRALRTNPDERYSTVEQMQADLLYVEPMLPRDGNAGSPLRTSAPPAATPTGGHSSSTSRLSTVADDAVRPSRLPKRSGLPVPLIGALVGLAIVAVLAVLYLRGTFGGKGTGGGSDPTKTASGAADAAPSPGAVAASGGGPAAADAGGASAEADAAAVTKVRVAVEGVPEGGRAIFGETVVETAPFAIEVARSDLPFIVTVEAPGWSTFWTDVVPSEDRVVQAKLQRSAAPPPEDAGGASDDRDAGVSGPRPGRDGGGRPATRRDAGRPAFVENPFP